MGVSVRRAARQVPRATNVARGARLLSCAVTSTARLTSILGPRALPDARMPGRQIAAGCAAPEATTTKPEIPEPGSTSDPPETTVKIVRLVMLAIAVAVAACSVINEQIRISSASGWIRKECRDPDAADYTRCEAACRHRYQR